MQMFWAFYRQISEVDVSGRCSHPSTLPWNQDMKKIKRKIQIKSLYIKQKNTIKCTLLPKYYFFFAGIRAYANSILHTKQNPP